MFEAAARVRLRLGGVFRARCGRFPVLQREAQILAREEFVQLARLAARDGLGACSGLLRGGLFGQLLLLVLVLRLGCGLGLALGAVLLAHEVPQDVPYDLGLVLGLFGLALGGRSFFESAEVPRDVFVDVEVLLVLPGAFLEVAQVRRFLRENREVVALPA